MTKIKYEVFYDRYRNKKTDTRLDGSFFDNLKDATDEYETLVERAEKNYGVSLIKYTGSDYETIKFYDPYNN